MMRLLDMFGRFARAKDDEGRGGRQTGERRGAPRYTAVDNHARLCWPQGDGFGDSVAWISDISQAGAQVVVETPPPPDSPVWLLLEAPIATDWCPAIVVSRWDTAAGTHVLGLHFPHCPYDLFKAVRGLMTRDAAGSTSPEFATPHWR